MPFQAIPAITGVPDFGLIHIDADQTAKAFQTYLNTASKLTGVSLDDISTRVTNIPVNVDKVTLAELIGVGMKLFDAVVWLHAGKPTSHPLKIDPSLTRDAIPSLHEVARAVFYCYFMLLTQARYPAPSNASDKPKIPNFLRTIMGMEKDQGHYVELICTFAPQKFDPTWVKFVRFNDFGQEVLSRFGLGVAGYRMFGPFGLYPAKPDIADELKPAFEFARTLATSPASWDIHPLTRNPTVLTSRGNLNKNLGNLILESFSEEHLAEMIAAKVIYKKPEREAAHRNYTQWEAEDNISGSAMIFRNN
jgi:hypothetical protein